jgi:hypothetical protein
MPYCFLPAAIVLYRTVALVFADGKKEKFLQVFVTVLSFISFGIKRPLEERKKVRTENGGTGNVEM